MRSQEICEELIKTYGQDNFRPIVGLPISPYFSATKLMWLFKNYPDLKKRAENNELCVGTIDSWLLYKLSNGKHHITDVTNASRTMLMKLENLSWDNTMLKVFNIPKCILPKIVSSSEIYFKISKNISSELENVPVSGCLGDQQAALFGQTCFKSGEVKNTYGTGCFMMMNTGKLFSYQLP